MPQVLNLFRSILFFTLVGLSFQSMSDQGSFSIPHEAISKYKQAKAPLYTEASILFKISFQKPESLMTVAKAQPMKMQKRVPSSISKITVENNSKSILNKNFNQKPSAERHYRAKDLCAVAKKNKGLNFKTPTSYLSSILKKAGAVNTEEPLFQDHADLFWPKYLSQNNFEDISMEQKKKGDFSFEQLEEGTLIVLEKSCFGKGTVALYCDDRYYATRFVKTERLLKKINTQGHKCQLGKGMRIVVEGKGQKSSVQSIARNH